MNKLLTVGLVGAGGLILYGWARSAGLLGEMVDCGRGVKVPKGATCPTIAAPPGGTSTSPAAAMAPSGTWDKYTTALVAAGYNTSSLLSCDQWNYFYPGTPPDVMAGCVPIVDVMGITGPARTNPVTYDYWRAWMASKGLGRLRRPMTRARRAGYVGHVSTYGTNVGWRSA